MGRKRKSYKSYLKGVFYGSLIGAGLAIFYTPRRGEQSQELLRDIAEETRQRAEEFSQTFKEQSEEFVKFGEDIYSQGKVLIEDALNRLIESSRSTEQDMH